MAREYRMIGDAEFGRHGVLVVYMDGFAGHIVRWTANCSGCTVSEDGHIYSGPHGCSECGYRGIRRHSAWVAIDPNDMEKWMSGERNGGKDVCK